MYLRSAGGLYYDVIARRGTVISLTRGVTPRDGRLRVWRRCRQREIFAADYGPVSVMSPRHFKATPMLLIVPLPHTTP